MKINLLPILFFIALIIWLVYLFASRKSGQNTGLNVKIVDDLRANEILHGETLLLGKLKDGKPVGAHVHLSSKSLPPFNERTRLKYKPPGYHAIKFHNGQYVVNRGHLIARELSGLDDVPENLFTITGYMNTGSTGDTPDDFNPASMLYYENRLRHYLTMHPTDYLDYSVVLNYEYKNDLVPTSVTLRYIVVRNGKRVTISLGSPKERVDPETGFTTVTLMNKTYGAVINYQTGYIFVLKHKKHK